MTSFYKVSSASLNKSLEVPTSKSYANRILILASISKESSTISNVPDSTDVKTMISLLKQIGLVIDQNGSTVTIHNSFPECEGKNGMTLNTGDGGTTNRFILPLLARGKNEYVLEAKGHMRNRPMDPLVKALTSLGVKVSSGEDHWLKVQGPYKEINAEVEVDCKDSTQFATGLALATADMGIHVIPKALEASMAYYQMTKHLKDEFMAQQRDWEVPVDFSGLGYPLALALVSGEVKITNCKRIDEFQADSIFLKIMEEMGAEFDFSNDGLFLKKPEYLMPFEIDGSSCPDLVPTLAFVASYASGASHIRNIEILRHKESDRVEEVLSLLKAFDIKHEFDSETHNLIIFGEPSKRVGPVNYDPPADHRIIMVAYLFMRVNGGGNLSNFLHVDKSFPNFFQIME